MYVWNRSTSCLCAVLSIFIILSKSGEGNARMSNDDDDVDDFLSEMTGIGAGNPKQGPKRELKPFPKIVRDNGMFHFVLKDIAAELVKLLEEEGLTLNARQRDLIHDKIESIYQRSLDHPALESDLIAFEPKKPDFHLYTPDSVLSTHAQEQRAKRVHGGPYMEVCESDLLWDTMPFARMLNHTRAKVYRGFQFHMKKCTSTSEGRSCPGINTSLRSECQTTGTWVRALVCGRCNFGQDRTCNRHCPSSRRDYYEWEWVYTPTCCKCAYEADLLFN